MIDNDIVSGGAVLMLLGGLLAYLRMVPTNIMSGLKRRYLVVVDIPDSELSFNWFRAWLEVKTADRRRGLWTVHLRHVDPSGSPAEHHQSSDRPQLDSGPRRQRFVVGFSPAPGTHVVWHKGRLPLIVRRLRRDVDVASGNSWRAYSESFEVISMRDRDEVAEIIAEGRALCEVEEPAFRIWRASWDNWQVAKDCHKRPADSVILPNDRMNELVSDMAKFFRCESWYAERGIPHRRGYLFYGSPGNGKSSVVSAIASQLSLDVYILPLASSRMDDDRLGQLIGAIPKRSLILLEDIDCLFNSRSDTIKGEGTKADVDNSLTFSGFLNAIDGVAASEGRILILTTNHPERLDPALLRPGRVDAKYEFADATPEQGCELLRHFYRDHQLNGEVGELAEWLEGRSCSMARLQGHFIRYGNDPAKAVRTLVKEQDDDRTTTRSSVEGPALDSAHALR